MIKIYTAVICILLILSSVVNAEYRIWTDVKGRTVEAEFEGVNSGKIVLKTKKGNKMGVELSALSQSDQDYLKGKLPESMQPKKETSSEDLKFEVSFSKIEDSRTKYLDDITCKLKIKMSGAKSYDGALKAYMYVIGESNSENTYILCDKSEFEFKFERGKESVFMSNMFTLYDSSSINYGAEYKGYLVLIKDESDKTILVKASSTEFDEKRSLITGFKKGDYFNPKSYKVVENHSQYTYYY